jgi:hypothetical protein
MQSEEEAGAGKSKERAGDRPRPKGDIPITFPYFLDLFSLF